MEMKIDGHATLFGDPEHHIEMSFDVAVERSGIEAADDIRAVVERRVQQLRRSGASQNPALREGDELDVDKIAVLLPHSGDRFKRFQANAGIDHDMASHFSGAVGDA